MIRRRCCRCKLVFPTDGELRLAGVLGCLGWSCLWATEVSDVQRCRVEVCEWIGACDRTQYWMMSVSRYE